MNKEQLHIKNGHFYTSVKQIPTTVWETLQCAKHVYFNSDYLISLEKNNTQVQFLYLVFNDNSGKPIAFTSIQFFDFFIDSMQNDLELLLRTLKNIAKKLCFIPLEKPLKVVAIGNIFVSGEHGVFIKDQQDKKQVLTAIAKTVLHYVNSDPFLKDNINIFMYKDFEDTSLSITSCLEDLNYYALKAEPNMQLHLDPEWRCFDDYLASMKTKFRVKAKKAFQLSKELRIENVTPDNIQDQLPKMTDLYQKVASKANFNFGDFNLATYQSLLENFKDAYILKTYWLNDQIVGFISGIVNGKKLDAHFVGIDYDKNRTHAIYQRMLYDYIEIAIQHRIKILNFGRTASEIKSSVGAVPQNLTAYVRHKKSMANRLLKLFLQKIQPTPFHQKFPFKIKKEQ